VTGSRLRWRRILSVAVCYAVALQAFLAAFETTVAVSRPGTPDVALVICHGADDNSPSTGGTGNSEKLPCALCAAAAAATGLLPDPIPATVTPLSLVGCVSFTNATTSPIHPPARPGSSRAPPYFA
jgi:hypothetical protein